jgi:hypothetical protein
MGGVAVLPAAALLMHAGCSAQTSVAVADDAGPFEGGGEGGTSSCSACVADQCTGPWVVCMLDPACRAMNACAKGTSGTAAKRACVCEASADAVDGGVDPRAAYLAYATCNDARTCTKCASDCTSSCAGGAASTAPSCGGAEDASAASDAGDAGDAADADATAPPPSGVDACASCVANRCGDPKKTCALGTECASFLSCTAACGDAACADDCGRRFASGKELAVELSNCTLAGCRSSCGL